MTGTETLSIANGMGEVDRKEWDALASRYYTPFFTWGFLALLEDSLSIAPETGWTPFHFLLHREDASSRRRLIAAAPFYAKMHSMGEFVFDFEFARLAEELKTTYYPKLIGMIPATPVPLWRVLIAKGEDEAEIEHFIMSQASKIAKQSKFGGFHLPWYGSSRAPPENFRRWDHSSFLWTDTAYGDFDGYLASFSKNMRRNVLRERASVKEAGVECRIVGVKEASENLNLLSRMADFYELTNDQFGPWGAKFLTRDFFLRLGEYLSDGWFLSAGFRGTEPIGLALLFEDKQSIYGRYWGASEKVDGLHFELCYYLPIEYALSKGIGRFDPGMGSEHKARRGFRSVLAPSYHLAFDERLARAFEYYLPLMNAEEEKYAEALNKELPFKKSPSLEPTPMP
ncbi:GNAT family N-acetyltransferase [Treponema sp.]